MLIIYPALQASSFGQTDHTLAIPLNPNAATDGQIDDTMPRVATDRAGHWVAIWNSEATATQDGDILVARSVDDGASWTAPAALNSDALTDSADDIRPQLATDGNGLWLAIWQGTGRTGDDSDIFLSRSVDNGATWDPPVTLYPGETSDLVTEGEFEPQIATDSSGHWVVVWSAVGGSNHYDIFVVTSGDNTATWSSPLALNSDFSLTDEEDQDPQLATDAHGNWVCVWHSFSIPSLPSDPEVAILFARSTDNGATWSPRMPLNDPAADHELGNALPEVCADQSGHFIAVWPTDVSGGNHNALAVSRSSDGGSSWTMLTPIGVLPDPLASVGGATLANDHSGNWLALWSRRFIGGNDQIAFARSNDNGASWSAPEVIASSSALLFEGDPWTLEVATDGAGHWVGVWQVVTSLDRDIYYTRWFPRDADGDSLSDDDEINLYGTDPNKSDTDGDGVEDEVEISLGTDPLDDQDTPAVPLNAWVFAALTLSVFGSASLWHRQRH